MNRKHKGAEYLALVAEIRAARPDIALSSDFIVGFPGETEEDFDATLDLIEKVEFASAFSFKYSARPGTPAAEAENQIPDAVKAERLLRLQTRLDQQRHAFNRKMVGRALDVLIEKPGRHAGQIAGKSPYLQPVQMEGSLDRIGEIVRVEIVAAGSQFAVWPALAGPARARGVSLKPSDRSGPFARQDFRRPAGETDTAEITLAFDDNRHASLVFGQYDQNLAKLERRLGVIANANGNHVTIKGKGDACEHARLVLENLYARVELGQPVGLGDVDGAIEEGAMQGTLFPKEEEGGRARFSSKSAPAGAGASAPATRRKTSICAR